MPLTKSLTRKTAGGRRNQFGVTLDDGPAEMLRAAAKRRRVYATTLAAELLEEAILEREAGRAGAAKELAELRKEIQTLAINHKNGLVKLMAHSGMSREQIEDWKKY